jgi:NADH:ubiquinone oxidoreductase subunit 6 (subunit J)
MWFYIILVGIIFCAYQAVRDKRLLLSAMWLAGTSALVSIMMYLLGAYQIAVIELSVGAGLVTVLFVFAINIAGDEPIPNLSFIPKSLARIFIVLAILIIGWQILPLLNFPISINQDTGFQLIVWESRKVDLYLQVVMIFAGVISMLRLLTDDFQRQIPTEVHE